MAQYRTLVALCVEALSTFDPSSMSVEDHLERFLQSSRSEVWLVEEGEGTISPPHMHRQRRSRPL